MKLRFLKKVLVITSILLIGCTSTYEGDYVKAMEEFNKPSNSSGDTSLISDGSIVGNWTTGCIQLEYDLYMVGKMSFYDNANASDKLISYADKSCSAVIESEVANYSYSAKDGILTLNYMDEGEAEYVSYTINSNILTISTDYEEMVLYRE